MLDLGGGRGLVLLAEGAIGVVVGMLGLGLFLARPLGERLAKLCPLGRLHVHGRSDVLAQRAGHGGMQGLRKHVERCPAPAGMFGVQDGREFACSRLREGREDHAVRGQNLVDDAQAVGARIDADLLQRLAARAGHCVFAVLSLPAGQAPETAIVRLIGGAAQ